MHSYNAIKTLHGYLYKIFPEIWAVKKTPKNLNAPVLGRKRQRHFQDYWKSFVSMLILLMNNQIRGNVKRNLGNLLDLCFQLSFIDIGQKISGFYLVQNTGSPRNRFWDLMIHITVHYSQRVLELKCFKDGIKNMLISIIFWYMQFPSYTEN